MGLPFWAVALIITAVTVVSSALLFSVPKVPDVERSPDSLEDFNIPVANEGREIPVLFGTREISDPTICWYGSFQSSRGRGDENFIKKNYEELSVYESIDREDSYRRTVDADYGKQEVSVVIEPSISISGTNEVTIGWNRPTTNPDEYEYRDLRAGVTHTVTSTDNAISVVISDLIRHKRYAFWIRPKYGSTVGSKRWVNIVA